MFSEYVLILVWVGLAGLFLSNTSLKRRALVCGEEVDSTTWAGILVFITPLILLATFRGNIGDTYAYVSSFRAMPESFENFSSYYSSLTKDKGFYIFSALLKIIFNCSSTFYLFLLAALQMFFLSKTYKTLSSSFYMSMFMFVASTDYIGWMFNGIRQFCAAVIVFFSSIYLLKKKYIRCILLILLASTFHQSALIMIPIILIIRGKAFNKKTVLAIFAILIAVVFIDSFTGALDSVMQDTQYQSMVSDWTEWDDDGTNPIRVLFYAVPTILSLFKLKQIRKIDNKIINMCVNFSICSTGVYILSIFTSGIFIGRLPIYMSLHNYILLPWLIKNTFNKQYASILNTIIVVVYLLFYYFQMHFAWSFI